MGKWIPAEEFYRRHPNLSRIEPPQDKRFEHEDHDGAIEDTVHNLINRGSDVVPIWKDRQKEWLSGSGFSKDGDAYHVRFGENISLDFVPGRESGDQLTLQKINPELKSFALKIAENSWFRQNKDAVVGRISPDSVSLIVNPDSTKVTQIIQQSARELKERIETEKAIKLADEVKKKSQEKQPAPKPEESKIVDDPTKTAEAAFDILKNS